MLCASWWDFDTAMNIAEILDQEPELANLAKRLRTEPDLPFPILSAKIKLTWRCNLRCSMCNSWRGRKTPGEAPRELPTPAVKNLLTVLRQRGCRKVHFSGGEVCMLQSLPDTIAFARNLGLQVNLTTNGTLIDKPIAQMLIEHRVHNVTISIDAADPKQHDKLRGVKGAWKEAWRGIGRIRERRERKGRGPHLSVNTVVSRDNIQDLAALYDLLKERHVDHWNLLPLDTEHAAQRPSEEEWRMLAEQWDQWRPMLRRTPIDWSSPRSAERAGKGKYAGVFYGEKICFAPWFSLFVDPYGFAYPCCMGRGQIRTYGNLLHSSIEEIVDGEARRAAQCTMAAGAPFTVCDRCDDFLEENNAFTRLYTQEKIK